jgi:transposase
METALLSEIEISQYCRKKGLFPEQIQEWKVACEKWG